MIPENHINRNASPDAEAEETVEVDLNAEVEVADATADVNVAPPLPPAGIYPVKWKVQKDKSVNAKATKPKKIGDASKAFVDVSLQGELQASGEDYDGSMIFEYMNSIAFRGRPTSDIHHFMNICGSPAPNRIRVGELKTMLEEMLETEPIGMAQVQWEAQYLDANSQKQNDWKHIKLNGKVLNKMENFPKDSNGNYIQVVENPLDGSEVNARLYVVKHLSQAEAKKLSATA